jgi:DNA polymerase-3 subunit chi
MSQVNFYILNKVVKHPREHFTCKIANQIWSKETSIYIHTASISQAKFIDKLLWTFNTDSFLAHDILPINQPNIYTPIVIGYDDNICTDMDILINLTLEIPIFFTKFLRVIEIVDNSNREIARDHYSFYKNYGNLKLNHHKIN